MAVTIGGKTYQWVVRDQTGNVTQTGPEVAGPGAAGAAPANVAAPDNSALRGQLTGLLSTTTAAYNQLMQAGRDNDAFALRDALERFTRTGAQMGVNPWARTQAINDLRARMTTAARTFQGTTTANALAAQAEILEKVGNLDATSFNQAVQAHQSNLSGAQFGETQRLNTYNMTNAWNQQQQAQAAARQAAMPVTNSSAEADARVAAMLAAQKTPIATPVAKTAFSQPVATPSMGAWGRPAGTTQASTPFPAFPKTLWGERT